MKITSIHFSAPPELSKFLRSCKSALIAVGILSAIVNILVLTSSLYMLQVYDRAIPSGSLETLAGLSVGALLLYFFQGGFDIVRQRIMSRIGAAFDLEIGPLAYSLESRILLEPRSARRDGQPGPLRDLETVRGFLGGLGPTVLFDLPWLPIYLAFCFVLHPILGALSVAGAVMLWALALLTEFVSRGPSKAATLEAAGRAAFGEAARRNAEILATMNLRHNLRRVFSLMQGSQNQTALAANDRTGALSVASKTARIALQSALLGTGAWLVITGQASSGVMIASSIMMGRALSPIELAIAHWRSFIGARTAWRRLSQIMAELPAERPTLLLPAPERDLTIENLIVGAPGEQEAFVQGVGFRLVAGDGLAVVGPSGSGKSTLVRAIAGVWRPLRGAVRLDGASLDQWGAAGRGLSIGYLPQDVELFDGTVAENIARFAAETDAAAITAAAEAAGAHGLITSLPQGYETRVGTGGARLSGGQRQRIGLARALYGNPFLVVLDEPNSNLDGDGEAALTVALRQVRARGGIAIVVAHRPSVTAALDKVLVMAGGRQRAFGPKDEILPKITLTNGNGPPLPPGGAPPRSLTAGEG